MPRTRGGVSRHLTVNYGLRYQTTYGLFFEGSGPKPEKLRTMRLWQALPKALQIPLTPSVPHDDHKQFAPRLRITFSPSNSEKAVIRVGYDVFHITIWRKMDGRLHSKGSTARMRYRFVRSHRQHRELRAHRPRMPAQGGTAAVSNLYPDQSYKTPCHIHITGGVQHAFNEHWTISADYTPEQGNHGYRAYGYLGGDNLFTPLIPASDTTNKQAIVPSINVFNSDNRSSFNSLMLHVQGNTPSLQPGRELHAL